MSKLVYIILFLLGIIVLVNIVLYFNVFTGEDVPDGRPTILPPPPDGTPPDEQASTIELRTSGGATVSVRNFLQDPRTTPDPANEGYYQLGNYVDPTVIPSPDVPYSIEYIARTQYFTVSLLEEPLSETRKDAEQFLLEFLGVSEAELCQLKHSVSVPNRVNQFYAGVSLDFSFCPGSVELE